MDTFEVVELGSDYGVFTLQCPDGSSVVAEVPPDNTLVSTIAEDEFGRVAVHGGSQWGPYSVAVGMLESAPTAPDASWEDVVEFSVQAETALAVSELIDADPLASVTPNGGSFRVRISARGRTESRDRDGSWDEGNEGEDNRQAVEHFLVESWPSAVREPVVLRLSSRYAAEIPNPPIDPVLPERAAGLRAAQAIGRDIDGGPGARTLSGEVGTVTVSRRLAGARRRHFTLFAHVTSWNHDSHGFISGPGWDQVGGESWTTTHPPYDGSEGDNLTGTHGMIRTVFVELQSPSRAVRTWEWIRPDASGEVSTDHQIPVLARPSTIRSELVQDKDPDGSTWTVVTLTHSDLPVEWLGDMTAYWEWHLAIVAAER